MARPKLVKVIMFFDGREIEICEAYPLKPGVNYTLGIVLDIDGMEYIIIEIRGDGVFVVELAEED